MKHRPYKFRSPKFRTSNFRSANPNRIDVGAYGMRAKGNLDVVLKGAVGIGVITVAYVGLKEIAKKTGKCIGKKIEKLFDRNEKDSADKTEDTTNTAPETSSEGERGPAKASTVNDIINEEHESRTDLVGGLIAEDTINVLVGAAKTGKSRLAVTMAIDIAAGRGPRVLNMRSIRQPACRVIYYDFEQDRRAVKERFKKETENLPSNFTLIAKEDIIAARIRKREDLIGDIKEQLKGVSQNTVVFIDNISKIRLGTSTFETQDLYDDLDKIKEDTLKQQGVCVTFIILAHTTKLSDSNKPLSNSNIRGSSLLVSLSDSVIAFESYLQGGDDFRVLRGLDIRHREDKNAYILYQSEDSALFDYFDEMPIEEFLEQANAPKKEPKKSPLNSTAKTKKKTGPGRTEKYTIEMAQELFERIGELEDPYPAIKAEAVKTKVDPKTIKNKLKEVGWEPPKRGVKRED